VNNENGDLLTEYHNIFKRWKNYISQLLNVNSVSDVRQKEIPTVESLVSCTSPLEVEIAIAELKKYKSPGSGQILTEIIQAADP
jgi:hypothetical protein